jgi:hypothetical protein
MIMNDKKIDVDTCSKGKGSHAVNQNAGTSEMEERALSVFASERNEDLTALVFCLITTFLVLMFTKWLA